MSEQNKAEGAGAFASGTHRSENPHPRDSAAWLDWADGFDQAQCRAEHPLPEGAERSRVVVA